MRVPERVAEIEAACQAATEEVKPPATEEVKPPAASPFTAPLAPAAAPCVTALNTAPT